MPKFTSNGIKFMSMTLKRFLSMLGTPESLKRSCVLVSHGNASKS